MLQVAGDKVTTTRKSCCNSIKHVHKLKPVKVYNLCKTVHDYKVIQCNIFYKIERIG